MKRKLLCALMIMLLFIWEAEPCVYASNLFVQDKLKADMPDENTIKLYAQSATLMDAVSGRILFEKNGEEEKPNASTTKIMTCIMALEYVPDLNEIVEVSDYAAKQPKVHLGMRAGESYKIENLLYSMMLESHNDSAVAVAEAVGRKMLGASGEEAEPQEAVLRFVDAMNQKALELGCEHTCFVTPNGLDAVRVITDPQSGEKTEKRHVTSSTDLACIMSYCVNESPCREKFLQITGTASYQFGDETNSRHFECINRNALLTQRRDAVSGKTGFTNAAGYCYVGTVSSEGRLYTVALLGAGWPGNKSYKWKDCKTLFDYGETFYQSVAMEKNYDAIAKEIRIPVLQGKGKDLFETPICIASVDETQLIGLPDTMLLAEDEVVNVDVYSVRSVQAPVKLGQKIGIVRVSIDDKVWFELPILAKNEIEMTDPKWFLWQAIIKYCSV